MTTNYIDIDSILIPENRQRRVFAPEQLVELVDSIQYTTAGLLHPIVVRQEGGKVYLVSGERRLRAITDIYALGGGFNHAGKAVTPRLVPVTLLGELSPIDAMEAELDENIRRADLTWQERARATEALAELRAAQAAVSGEAVPTVLDLAREIYNSDDPTPRANVKKDLIVAKHLDNEKVRNAKTVDEAYKILKREEQTKKHEQLAAEVGRDFSSSKHQLYHGNSEDWFADAEPSQFSVILTDPPYGMSADTFGDSGGATSGAHLYDDSYENWQDIMDWFAPQSFRVAAKRAHLYCFLDIDNFHEAKDRFAAAGWRVFRTPLIWVKPAAFRAPWPEHGPQRKYECILFAVKGDKKVNHLAGDVITCPPDANLGHNAQKPVELLTELLRRSAVPGDKILDPFCGSGSIFPAATAVNCYAVGVEMADYAYGIAASRLKIEG